LKSFFLKFLPFLLITAVWQYTVSIDSKLDFFLGSPLGIAKEFINLAVNSDLFYHFFITAYESLMGFIIGTLLGTIIGLALWSSETVYKIAKPYLVVLGSVPVFALGPILIFWFGTGIISKVMISFLSTLVIAIVQSNTGANQVDSNIILLIKAFGGKKRDIYRHAVIPSSVIWVLTGIRINIGMALLGAFVGEFIASNCGLGHLIVIAEGLFNVNQIWVGILGIVLIAILYNFVSYPIEQWAAKWKKQ
jgi:NitT/TauT family transport system permease protein